MSTEPPPTGVRKIEAIINAGSGTMQQKGMLEKITHLLQSSGTNIRLTVARSGSDLEELARAAAISDADVVVAAGGDGTISGIASQLIDSGKLLGVLPLGTFNFFAKRLSIPLDLDQALLTITEGRVAEVNVGEVNGRIFLNKSSVGLYPLSVRYREKAYRRFGRNKLVALAAGCVALLRRGRVMKISVTTEAETRVFHSRLAFVCNNPQELERFNLRGRECLEQDKLAVYLPEPLSPIRTLALGVRMACRRLEQAPGYDALCAREMRLDTKRARLPVSVDGEVEMMVPPLYYRARARALRVIVPG